MAAQPGYGKRPTKPPLPKHLWQQSRYMLERRGTGAGWDTIACCPGCETPLKQDERMGAGRCPNMQCWAFDYLQPAPVMRPAFEINKLVLEREKHEAMWQRINEQVATVRREAVWALTAAIVLALTVAVWVAWLLAGGIK